MPPKQDRIPALEYQQTMLAIEDMRQLIRDVLTNQDRRSDSELITKLIRLKLRGVTQAETVQIIEDFPPKEISINGKNWLLNFVNRVYGVIVGRVPMKV